MIEAGSVVDHRSSRKNTLGSSRPLNKTHRLRTVTVHAQKYSYYSSKNRTTFLFTMLTDIMKK